MNAPMTKEAQALGAFLAAMHDSKLDGAEMRKAMLSVLGTAAQSAPAGYALVSLEELSDWKNRVNTLAGLSTKAERYAVGGSLKAIIADVIETPVPPELASTAVAQAEPVGRAGWVMVPMEPTDEMVQAAYNSFAGAPAAVYAAMLAASPTQPRPQPLTDEKVREIVTDWIDESDTHIRYGINLARDIEAAHGIKPAQEPTE